MRGTRAAIVVLALVLVIMGGYVGVTSLYQPGQTQTSVNEGVVQVVAAENFWGSLASQLGGHHAHVVSIVTDPNADPHQYESNPQNATAVAKANFVIENGAGYDDWMDKLISASNTPGQRVLNVATQLGYQEADQKSFSNEHFWYNPEFVNRTVNAMYKVFVAIDPADASYFRSQYSALNSSLHEYMALEADIRAHFAGTKVAATETIFLYMANATGLDVVSPFGFMKAVAEGIDPPAQDVATFQELLTTQPPLVRLLVYNSQTVTQVTDNMKSLAQQNHIVIVPVTETMQPVNATFQQWMTAELTSLQTALDQ